MPTTAARAPPNAEPSLFVERKIQHLDPESYADAVQQENPAESTIEHMYGVNGVSSTKDVDFLNDATSERDVNGNQTGQESLASVRQNSENGEIWESREVRNGNSGTTESAMNGESKGDAIRNQGIMVDGIRPGIERQESKYEYSATVCVHLN